MQLHTYYRHVARKVPGASITYENVNLVECEMMEWKGGVHVEYCMAGLLECQPYNTIIILL